MCREVLVEFGEAFKEAPAPGPGASPLAEGADALVAYVSSPQLRFCGPLRHLRDVYPERQCAIAYGFCDIDRICVHRKVLADGGVVTPVLRELAQHVRMRVGWFSKAWRGGNRGHGFRGSVFPLMLPAIHYGATPRVASTRRGSGPV